MDLLKESYKWGNGSLPDNTNPGLPDIKSGTTPLHDNLSHLKDQLQKAAEDYAKFRSATGIQALGGNLSPLANELLKGTQLHKDGWSYDLHINPFYFGIRRDL